MKLDEEEQDEEKWKQTAEKTRNFVNDDEWSKH